MSRQNFAVWQHLGMGWARVIDTLGPVVRDCEGRVFTLADLPEMLTVALFPQLKGL